MTFAIRPAAPAEYAEVGELTANAYLADGLVAPGTGYGATLRAAADRAEQAELWVAATPEQLLGTVTFCPPGSPYREVGEANEGEFRMLAVSPDARGAGVGAALTKHCLQRTLDLGLNRVVLCSATAMTSAHRLYERLGFTRLPERDWEPAAGVQLLAFTLDL